MLVEFKCQTTYPKWFDSGFIANQSILLSNPNRVNRVLHNVKEQRRVKDSWSTQCIQFLKSHHIAKI